MLLKQRFTNGNEQNTHIGNSYTLIERKFNPEGWQELYYSHLGRDKEGVISEDDAIAFVVYNEGVKPEIIPIYPTMYNAIMSDTGAIYNVITCMPI